MLLVDAGNTRIKWRAQQAGAVASQGVVATPQASQLAAAWRGLSAEAALVASVAGAQVDRAVQAAWGGTATRLRWLAASAEAHGVLNRYVPPTALGVDRFAALVGARHLCHADCLVVSVGTALTVDMLTRRGEFLGGCIAPGPDLMRAGLLQGTAGIATHAVHEQAGQAMQDLTPWPRTTADAVTQGIGLAMAGVVQGLYARLHRKAEQPPAILLTGGARAALKPFLPDPIMEVDELVLEGMTWIARDLGFDA